MTDRLLPDSPRILKHLIPVRRPKCARQITPSQGFTVAIAFSGLTVAIPCNAEPSVSAGKRLRRPTVRIAIPSTFTQSFLAVAPPIRTLHVQYAVESLEEALGEGIVTGHPSMPEFRLDPGQVGDFIVFLKSLEQIIDL